MDNTSELPTILSFCPGIRGLERGIERAIGGINVLAYVEIEAFIIANLVCAMEEGVLDPAPIWSDVKTFDAKPFRGTVNGIIGGYPCQPFSIAGKQLREADPRHLWPFIEQHIKDSEPDWCFFENVANHLTCGYREVRRSLESMGYAVKEGIYSAEEAGAPHQRNRLFILAIRKELVDTESAGNRRIIRNIHSKDETITQSEKQYENGSQHSPHASIEKLGNSRLQRSTQHEEQTTGFVESNTELADTDDIDVQRKFGSNFDQTIRGRQDKRPTGSCGTQRWPMPQGSTQYEWEEPRTIEPGMGCTVDGYNFRTDLLRAYGNAVVEQTAEIAFIDLLKQHYNVPK